MSLAQIDHHFPDGIPKHFVLLASDSTVSIFCNADLLTDIHDVDDPLYLATNGGHQISKQMGMLPNFGPVWYNPDSIANILSLAQARALRRVTMDTDVSPAFHVHKLDGSGTTIFSEHPSGLYLHDTMSPTTNHSNSTIVAYSCLQTVADNKVSFTARQVTAADNARRLYRQLGRPGQSRFIAGLNGNHILNCPLTADDARRAEIIYGKDVAFLKGKTTASPAPPHIQDVPGTSLPTELLSLHKDVTLFFDLFYVLGLAFSLSVSRNIHFLSSHFIADRSAPLIKSCVASDLKLYRARGFNPTDIHADGEFATIQSSFPDIRFTICAADAHVPEIERAIRTVKETVCATIHGMPFHRLPQVLVKELIVFATRSANILPHPDGVSPTLSPDSIVTGAAKVDFTTMRLEFGTYVQVYDGTSNDTKSRTLGAIATNPTGNSSGDYYFVLLATGHRIQRRSWVILPISDTVISQVEAIALSEEMPPIDTGHPLAEYDPDATVDLDTYDCNYVPPKGSNNNSDNILTSDAYTDTSDDDDAYDSDDDMGHHPDFDDAPAPVTIPPATNKEAPVENEERRAMNTVQPVTISNVPSVENEERTVQPVANELRTEEPGERTTLVTICRLFLSLRICTTRRCKCHHRRLPVPRQHATTHHGCR
jgi:hypothetical protein